jgi:hypothetical protein
MTGPTQAVCSNSRDGATHHLIPKRVSSEASELTCIWCRQTESQIRESLRQSDAGGMDNQGTELDRLKEADDGPT